MILLFAKMQFSWYNSSMKKLLIALMLLDVSFVAVFNSAFEETHAYIFIVVSFAAFILFLFSIKDSLKFDYSIIILVLFLPVSIIFSFYTYASMLDTYILLSAIIFYIIAINVFDERTLPLVQAGIMLIGLFVAFVGFLAYVLVATLPHLNLSVYFSSHSFLAGTRICSFFQYPNSFAGFLLMPFFFSLDFLNKAKGKRKWIYYLVSSFLLFVLYLSGSRGAFIVLGFAIILIYAFTDFKNYISITKELVITFLIVALFVFLNKKLFYAAIVANSERLKILIGFFAGEQNKSLADRIHLAKDAWNIFLHHPFFGTGLGTFKDAMLKYRNNLFFAREPHSMPFRLLAETGVLGFLAFFYFFVRSFLKGFKRNSILYIGVLSLFLHMFLDLDFAYPVIVSLIFIGIAMMSFENIEAKRFPIHAKYALGLIVISLLVLSVVPNFAASTFANSGETFMQKSEFNKALDNFRVAEKINPSNATYHSHIAYCIEQIAYQKRSSCVDDLENAAEEYRKASGYNKLSFIYPLYEGNINLLLKNPQAIALFKKSISLNPLWKPICADQALALSYILGEKGEAINLANEALNFTAGTDAYKALHYTSAEEKDSRAYTALGFAEKQKSYFERAITIFPKNGFAYLGLSALSRNKPERVEYLKLAMEVNPCIKEVRENYFAEAPLIHVSGVNTNKNGKISIRITVLHNRELLSKIIVDVVSNGKVDYINVFPPSSSVLSFNLPANLKGEYRIELVGMDKSGLTISRTISPLFNKKE